MSHHPACRLQPEDGDYDHNDEELAVTALSNPTGSIPKLCGIPLKYLSLVTLAVQNSALTVIMHYSRTHTPPSRTYMAATAVLMNEILKGLISFIIALLRTELPLSSGVYELAQAPHSYSAGFWSFRGRLFKLWRELSSPDCWKLSIPAILYVIQNNLQYVAVSNLEAATFQVTYQIKILTTAAFSVLLLRKRLAFAQWIALLFLAIGVGIVQIQVGNREFTPQNNPLNAEARYMSSLKGFLAVFAACFTSGLAGVYFEKVLKDSQTDLWVRNVQLSAFSLLPALAPIVFAGRYEVGGGIRNFISTLFRNFGVWAWATVFVQVLGGLLTAMVIKYSDNILKGFATSLSIVISFLASVALFNFQLTFTFILGSSIVLIATWLYSQQPRRSSSTAIKDSLGWTWTWNEKHRNSISLRSSPVAFNLARSGIAVSSTSTLASISTTLQADDREKTSINA